MKIVLFTDTYEPEVNGVSTSVTLLARVLKEHGHIVYVVTTNPFSKKVTFKDNILRIPGIKLKWLYDYILAPIYSHKAMKILRNIDADIIHVNTDFSIAQFAYLYAETSDAALVYTYHTMYEDYTYYITKGKADRISKWIVRQYSLAVAGRLNAIIAPSYKSLNYLRRIGVNSYISVVPTGTDTSRFRNYVLDPKKKKAFMNKYGIPEDSKIMLFLGRLAKEKNIEELLENFKIAKELYPNLYFVIVGDGPNKKDLEELSKKLNVDDKTIFVGKVAYDEIDFCYSIADLFVAASVSETQGLTYLEAMASRKIVLAKYDSNLTELIKDDVNGYFFETQEEFLEKLGKILNISHTNYSVLEKNMIESVQRLSVDSFYDNIIRTYERAKRNSM